MTAPIQDVSSLQGKKVSDQQGASIGKVKEIYTTGDDGQPVWVSVEGTFGTGDKRTVLIPIARLKEENGEVGVPYSKDRIGEAPEVDVSDGISAESDRELRGYYGIGVGDQELWSDNKSYATLVPDEPAEAKVADDADQLELPDPDTRTDESMERLRNAQSRDARDVGDITGEDNREDDDDRADQDEGDRADQDEDDRADQDEDDRADSSKDAKSSH